MHLFYCDYDLNLSLQNIEFRLIVPNQSKLNLKIVSTETNKKLLKIVGKKNILTVLQKQAILILLRSIGSNKSQLNLFQISMETIYPKSCLTIAKKKITITLNKCKLNPQSSISYQQSQIKRNLLSQIQERQNAFNVYQKKFLKQQKKPKQQQFINVSKIKHTQIVLEQQSIQKTIQLLSPIGSVNLKICIFPILCKQHLSPILSLTQTLTYYPRTLKTKKVGIYTVQIYIEKRFFQLQFPPIACKLEKPSVFHILGQDITEGQKIRIITNETPKPQSRKFQHVRCILFKILSRCDDLTM
eukprot:TRINITY_DN596_c0_g1_i16.p1 TRINITY_DN596_c0_g1~~TRINITY_DN596_c0_g1_i16.p1  ORF type:complete len:300 (-),score=-11.62 TRINITY_DN596_c0_g1_i16:226-1125(-)